MSFERNSDGSQFLVKDMESPIHFASVFGVEDCCLMRNIIRFLKAYGKKESVCFEHIFRVAFKLPAAEHFQLQPLPPAD